MNKYVILIWAGLMINACRSSPDGSQQHADHAQHSDTSHAHHYDPQTRELMSIHDSIMPKMGEIVSLKQQLKGIASDLDSLTKLKPALDLQRQKSSAVALIQRLEMADKAMMGWMHQYKTDTLEKLDPGQKQAYIADQKSKIQMVKDQMLAAVSASKDFVKNQQ